MAGSGGGQANALGIQGQITPRNFALAQFLAQQQRAQQETAARGQAARLEAASRVAASSQTAAGSSDRAAINALARQELEEFKAEAKANVTNGRLAQKVQQFDTQNQTNIWKAFLQLQAAQVRAGATRDAAGIRANAKGGGGAKEAQKLLETIAKGRQRFLITNAKNRGRSPDMDRQLDESEAALKAIEEVAAGLAIEGGSEEVIEPAQPGPFGGPFLGTPPKTEKKPPKATLTPPAGPGGGSAQPSAGKTVVKTQTNPQTGKRRRVYSDGTTEEF